jgi:hypothetical protein
LLTQTQTAVVQSILGAEVAGVAPAATHGSQSVVRIAAGGKTWIVKLNPHDASDPRSAQSMGFLPGLVGAAFVDSLGEQLSARFIGADLLIHGDAKSARRACWSTCARDSRCAAYRSTRRSEAASAPPGRAR